MNTTDIHQERHSLRRGFIVSKWVHHSLVQCRTLFLPLLAPLLVHIPGMITSLLRGTVRVRYSWLHCTEVEAGSSLFSRWYKALPMQVSSCEGIPSSAASVRLLCSFCPVPGYWASSEPIPLCPSPHTIQSQISIFKVERFQKVVTPTLSFVAQLQVSLELPYNRTNITGRAAPITLTEDLY